MASNPDQAVSKGSTLLGRLVGLAVLPTIGTIVLVICFFFLSRQPETGLPRNELLVWLGAVAIALVGVALQVWWMRRLDRTIRGPVEELVEVIDAGHPPDPGFGRRADWEVRLLFRRVKRLMDRDGSRVREEAEIVTEVSEVTHYLDRIATPEPPGDAAACAGVLTPVGGSLRALMERLDRREGDRGRLLERLDGAVGGIGERATALAGDREATFLALLEAVSGLREARQSVDAIRRERPPAGDGVGGGDTVDGMISLLGARLDHTLEILGTVSTQAESEASSARDLSDRAGRLRATIRSQRPPAAPGAVERSPSQLTL